jgi:hypothetical protein
MKRAHTSAWERAANGACGPVQRHLNHEHLKQGLIVFGRVFQEHGNPPDAVERPVFALREPALARQLERPSWGRTASGEYNKWVCAHQHRRPGAGPRRGWYRDGQ